MSRPHCTVSMQVPIGTVVTDWESKGVIADLGKEDSTCVVVKGGNGKLEYVHWYTRPKCIHTVLLQVSCYYSLVQYVCRCMY